MSVPQVDAAAKMVTKRIFQTTYSSVPQVNAAAEIVNCKAHSTRTRFETCAKTRKCKRRAGHLSVASNMSELPSRRLDCANHNHKAVAGIMGPKMCG